MTGNIGDLLTEREKKIATKNVFFEAFSVSLVLAFALAILAVLLVMFVSMMDGSVSTMYICLGFIALLPLIIWAIRAPFTIPQKKKLKAQIRERIKKEFPVGTEVSIGLSQDKKELRPTGTKTVYYHGALKVAEYDNYDKITKTTHRSASGVISEISQNSFTITMTGWTWGLNFLTHYSIKGGGKTEIKFLELAEDSVGAGGFFDNEHYYINYIDKTCASVTSPKPMPTDTTIAPDKASESKRSKKGKVRAMKNRAASAGFWMWIVAFIAFFVISFIGGSADSSMMAGLVAGLLLAVLGLALSILGVVKSRLYKKSRKGLAIAGIVFNTVEVLFVLILFIASML